METIQPQPDPHNADQFIVSVPIPSSPGDNVVMSADDYERWTREHGIRTLQIRQVADRAYVFFRPYGSKNAVIILSRYIMGSPKGRLVFLVDGDPLNLRRSNLGCRTGGGGGMTWKKKAPANAQSATA